jgi:ElaB/YqjD/DUF883 family membrane-anchored ribosome-binding protein
MNSDILMILLTVFVGMTAVSFVMQAIAVRRMERTARDVKQRVDEFLPKAESLIQNAEKTLSESRAQILQITTAANEVLGMAKVQMAKIDEVVSDATVRARNQLDRAEIVLEDTLHRVQHTVNTVHGNVVKPIREITGVAAGLRAALGHLLKGAPANVAQATADEEMFI